MAEAKTVECKAGSSAHNRPGHTRVAQDEMWVTQCRVHGDVHRTAVEVGAALGAVHVPVGIPYLIPDLQAMQLGAILAWHQKTLVGRQADNDAIATVFHCRRLVGNGVTKVTCNYN